MEKQRDYDHSLSPEQREATLTRKKEAIAIQRANETKLRRSSRLEADRANQRIRQAAKSKKDREKDAHEKWKQRYKK